LMCENSSGVFWVVDSILVIVDWRQVRVSFLGGIGGGGTGGRGYSNKCGKKDLENENMNEELKEPGVSVFGPHVWVGRNSVAANICCSG